MSEQWSKLYSQIHNPQIMSNKASAHRHATSPQMQFVPPSAQHNGQDVSLMAPAGNSTSNTIHCALRTNILSKHVYLLTADRE